MPDYDINEYAALNATAVKQLPEWKRQYELRVSSYNLPPEDNKIENVADNETDDVVSK